MPADQTALFEHIIWQDIFKTEKPYELFINLPGDQEKDTKRTNLKFETVAEQTIADARGKESGFSLDTHGFQWIGHKTAVTDFKSREVVARDYFPETEDLIRNNVEGADRVYIFDWRLRASKDKEQFLNSTIDLNSQVDPLYPANYPHVDQSHDGAINRVYYHLKEEADSLLKGRFRIINVWRPLYKVQQWPLAVCDARSVQQTDMIVSDFVRRTYVGETCFVQYSADHRWYYLSEQEPDEVTLLKIFDSSKDVEAKCKSPSCLSFLPPKINTPSILSSEGRDAMGPYTSQLINIFPPSNEGASIHIVCPHSSFKMKHPQNPALQNAARESVELRAMVFTSPPASTEYLPPPIETLFTLRFMPTILVRRQQRRHHERTAVAARNLTELKAGRTHKPTKPSEDDVDDLILDLAEVKVQEIWIRSGYGMTAK